MRFNDRSRAPRMRLLRFRLVKGDLHRLSTYCIVALSSIALFATGGVDYPGGLIGSIGTTRFAPSFTQEWPIFSQTHQFSYTIPYIFTENDNGMEDTRLNYRLQAFMEGKYTRRSSRVCHLCFRPVIATRVRHWCDRLRVQTSLQQNPQRPLDSAF